VIGSSVWNCQHKFRIVCGPLRLKDFTRLLPGQDSLLRLRDGVRSYVGLSVDWDLNLVLDSADVPRLSLGKSGVLGWTTWLGERQTSADADEVLIRPNEEALAIGGAAAGSTHKD
jgi:type VI secretion system protein ImpH